MDCPVCKMPMIILELNEVEIDHCLSCSGIWLDAGELELLIVDELEREKIISSFQLDEENSEKRYKCPVCKRKMNKIFVGERKELLIDKCPDNDGLWFDGGELKTLLKLGDKDNKVVELLNNLFATNLNNNQSGESL